jgi:hypothetical protein
MQESHYAPHTFSNFQIALFSNFTIPFTDFSKSFTKLARDLIRIRRPLLIHVKSKSMKPISTYVKPVLLVLLAAGAVSAEAQGNKKGHRYAVNRYPVYGQRVAAPPFGVRVNILPSGYFPFYTGGYPYYYSNGLFYRTVNRTRDYEVIEAPVGAEVPSLPSEARTMVIDGEKFYSVNGTYFKDAVKPNGELWYRVVGRNGVLNTNKTPDTYAQQTYPQ